jgi:hypothetical protein
MTTDRSIFKQIPLIVLQSIQTCLPPVFIAHKTSRAIVFSIWVFVARMPVFLAFSSAAAIVPFSVPLALS